MHILRLSLIALLLTAPAWAVSTCPATFNCSWTHGLSWSPAVPGTVTITWSQKLNGPVDHTQTADASTGSTSFEVTNGTWYVTISIVSTDGSVQSNSVTMRCVNADDCVPIGPAAPSGFKVT